MMLTNVASIVAYKHKLEDEQFWLDYQDFINVKSIERKTK